jgi:transcriptional regulator GlxA family with amidase domain
MMANGGPTTHLVGLAKPSEIQFAVRSTWPMHVAFVAYEGISLLDLSGPLEALRVASMCADQRRARPMYECSVLSAHGGSVMTADGVRIATEPVSAVDGRALDTLIVPGAFDVRDVRGDRDLIEWVRGRAPQCRRICSVCSGTFLLAEAGLLSGRRATTHWLHCGSLARDYPEITVEPDATYIRDGSTWTSAGVTTGIDLALALIEEDYGRPVAMHVARVLVVYLRRMGGQSQHSALLALQAQSTTDAFGELEHWICENLTADLRVERLAERAGMSPRNFARRYMEARKRTPARAVESIRVDAARRALEETDHRLDEIARHCGFSNEEHLRGVFARHLGISPRAYRKRFANA